MLRIESDWNAALVVILQMSGNSAICLDANLFANILDSRFNMSRQFILHVTKTLFVLIALCAGVTIKAQTKEETQVWLSYYLDRYFGSTYNQLDRNRAVKGYGFNTNRKYNYTTYFYSFNESYLKINEEYREMDSTGFSVIQDKRTIQINLKRIIMVEPVVDTLEHKFIGVEIKFSSPEFEENKVKEKSIIMYDSSGNKLSEPTSYAWNFHIRSENKESVLSRIEIKLANAIIHLAELNGAKVVKNLF